jgi:glycosyltransferase involved in cell wall biosynthesis
MEKISIQHVINSLGADGAQHMLLRLLSRLDRSRFDCRVISLLDYAPLLPQFDEIGVPVTFLGMRRRRPAPRHLLGLARVLRRARPQLVQTWLYHADLLGGVAAKLAGNLPVIWNIRHADLSPEANGRSSLYAARACAHLSRCLPETIVCCAESARLSHLEIGYAPEKFEVIPNGFDTDRFRPRYEARARIRRELALPADALLIGSLARFHPQKDHRNLIEAARILRERRRDVHFVLCGAGAGEENAQLQFWLLEAGLVPHFSLLGQRSDLPEIMAAFDLVTSSSRGEGFPNAIGEAMACGIPCVVTDAGDSALLVGSTGLVVPPCHPRALAGAWEQMLALEHAGREQLGLAARRRIVERYSIGAIVERYAELYQRVAGDDRSATPANLAASRHHGRPADERAPARLQ